jgi:16S rRNA (cytidine1402-2'-O)-methyltransferase
VVATPIGNLGDVSARAAEALAEADVVLAEDTRRARALLAHLRISGKPVERLDASVEARPAVLEGWVARLRRGGSVALCTDAGTPGVSDPGAALVRAVAAAGLGVTPVAGPSAVTAALSVSGFGGGRFRFFGFLPRAGGARRRCLEEVAATAEPVVLFEAPPRMAATLRELAERMPEREALVARELSKLHEELLRGPLAALAEREAARRWRGEITLVLGSWERPAERADEEAIARRAAELAAGGMRPRAIVRALAAETRLSSRDLYALVLRARAGT